MLNVNSLLVLSAIEPYLTYILVGLFVLPMLIAAIVGAKKGFRSIGWGGLIWGCIVGGFIAGYELIKSFIPVDNMALVKNSGTGKLATALVVALVVVFAALVLFGFFGLLFRPRDKHVKKEYHYYAKSSPYAQVAKGGKYVIDSPYDEETEEDYEERVVKQKKGKIQTVKGGKPCFLNRFFGAVVGAINAAVVVAVILGFVLIVLNATALKDGLLKPIYQNKTVAAVFPYLLKYGTDCLLLGIMALYVRRGYKMGIASGLRSLIVPVLKFGAIVGGLYLPFSPLAAQGKMLAFIGVGSDYFASLLSKFIPASVAAVTAIVGKLAFGVVLVLAFLIVVFIIGWLLDRVIDGAEKNGFVAFLDGSLAAVLYLLIGALVCAIIVAILYLVEYLGYFQSSALFTTNTLTGEIYSFCESLFKTMLSKFGK